MKDIKLCFVQGNYNVKMNGKIKCAKENAAVALNFPIIVCQYHFQASGTINAI
jgi:hypothetical protein